MLAKGFPKCFLTYSIHERSALSAIPAIPVSPITFRVNSIRYRGVLDPAKIQVSSHFAKNFAFAS